MWYLCTFWNDPLEDTLSLRVCKWNKPFNLLCLRKGGELAQGALTQLGQCIGQNDWSILERCFIAALSLSWVFVQKLVVMTWTSAYLDWQVASTYVAFIHGGVKLWLWNLWGFYQNGSYELWGDVELVIFNSCSRLFPHHWVEFGYIFYHLISGNLMCIFPSCENAIVWYIQNNEGTGLDMPWLHQNQWCEITNFNPTCWKITHWLLHFN